MLATSAGLEPATLCLEGRCSIQLSYGAAGKEIEPKVTSDQAFQQKNHLVCGQNSCRLLMAFVEGRN